MPRLTGTVTASGTPAEGAYIQLRSVGDDFVGEVRARYDGRFVLHPVPGRWKVVSWLPGRDRLEREVEVGSDDVDLDLVLG